jgi:hypothetical protein
MGDWSNGIDDGVFCAGCQTLLLDPQGSSPELQAWSELRHIERKHATIGESPDTLTDFLVFADRAMDHLVQRASYPELRRERTTCSV